MPDVTIGEILFGSGRAQEKETADRSKRAFCVDAEMHLSVIAILTQAAERPQPRNEQEAGVVLSGREEAGIPRL